MAVGLPVILRYYGSTCHLIRGNGFYLFSGKDREINYIFRLLLENKGLIEHFKICAEKMRLTFSYYEIAKESIDYYHDLSPKRLHNIFMDDSLCKFKNINWYKLIN
jgi:glycosyltransferase involved in cell wall biosynthesis